MSENNLSFHKKEIDHVQKETPKVFVPFEISQKIQPRSLIRDKRVHSLNNISTKKNLKGFSKRISQSFKERLPSRTSLKSIKTNFHSNSRSQSLIVENQKINWFYFVIIIGTVIFFTIIFIFLANSPKN